MDVFIVSECCPVGCGYEVILLEARCLGSIFAYCDACGCVWRTPAEARFERGLDEIVTIAALAPHGVVLPAWAEVVAAGHESSVLRRAAPDEWLDVLDTGW